ncbi:MULTISPECIES: DUF962 domain-containing protein [unclassified Acinetobacter]|uniref:Mpo1 family 2-hydroxy fatty acid dioxygenase n=1 Tax=unclassified Acinetobacter TaxID=196816 RepID=UPI002934CD34|nr:MULTISPECIES: Mpo1-like protein [unclassified Acinetobacter]WOE32534.1 DUF962 domain-containing protein [Acinetobacter sp. SAAs470]WOE38010.1 DUF962 domain-containing protein [Acinetobacter sp. SAAs474]
MTRIARLLSQYAAYHLEPKNVMTHLLGIPMIVFALLCLTARAEWQLFNISMTLAALLMILAVIYYLCLDGIFALVIAVIFILIYPYALMVSHMALTDWLFISILLFIVGWILQFLGHFYEKKKPAFMDDLIGLLIGPLFVVAELFFLLGLRKSLQQQVLSQAKQLRARMDHSIIGDDHQ